MAPNKQIQHEITNVLITAQFEEKQTPKPSLMSVGRSFYPKVILKFQRTAFALHDMYFSCTMAERKN